MKAQRGTVRRVTFEIEYPDGRRKERVFDGSDGIDPGDIHAIVFEESFFEEDDKSSFTPSDDWQLNPTMGIYTAPRGNTHPAILNCTVSADNGC